MFVLLACLTVAAAHPDAARFFENAASPVQYAARATRLPMPEGGLDQVAQTVKTQGAMMIEQVLERGGEETSCLARAVCQFAVRGEGAEVVNENNPTLGQGVRTFTKFIEQVSKFIEKGYEKLVASSNAKKLIGAAEIGKVMGEPACRNLFDCSEDYAATEQQGRVTCEGAGKICPGLSIGCAMCGLYAPAICGSSCTVAGLYCGFGGYACAGK